LGNALCESYRRIELRFTPNRVALPIELVGLDYFVFITGTNIAYRSEHPTNTLSGKHASFYRIWN